MALRSRATHTATEKPLARSTVTRSNCSVGHNREAGQRRGGCDRANARSAEATLVARLNCCYLLRHAAGDSRAAAT